MKSIIKLLVLPLAVAGVLVVGLAPRSAAQGITRAISRLHIGFFDDGTAAAPSMAFASEPGTGWYRAAANDLRLALNGGAANLRLVTNFVVVRSLDAISWSSTTDASSAVDTQLLRDGPGIVKILQSTTTDSAIRNYSMNSGYWERGAISELLTLSTSGVTTDTAANLLPANSIIEAVVARVTTTITTATDWKLGDATIAGRFSAANATMTAGTTQVGLVHVDLTGTSGPRQTAAAKLRVTTTGTPGAGAIRITVFYRTFVPPTS